MKLYIWPNGIVHTDNGDKYWELPRDLSDDFFTVDCDELSLEEVKALIFSHFAFTSHKDGEYKTEQAEGVFGEAEEYYNGWHE